METTWCHDSFYGDYGLRNALKSMFFAHTKNSNRVSYYVYQETPYEL